MLVITFNFLGFRENILHCLFLCLNLNTKKEERILMLDVFENHCDDCVSVYIEKIIINPISISSVLILS